MGKGQVAFDVLKAISGLKRPSSKNEGEKYCFVCHDY